MRHKHVLPVPPWCLSENRMTNQSPYHFIIAGQAGAWAAPLRGALRIAESAYALGVRLRNRRYDRKGPLAVLPIPVISVGNITVGGTGKTPFVIELVRQLQDMGYNPAVASRGYRASGDDSNDEERVIRARCPGVVCVCDPDRIRAAEIAHSRFGADVVVLDDGFQHRRLGRTLDIALIDATCPFGYGHLLPRGLLREPVRNLARAQILVITRHDQVAPAELSRIAKRLRGIAGDAVHLRCGHAVTGISRLDGTPVKESVAGNAPCYSPESVDRAPSQQRYVPLVSTWLGTSGGPTITDTDCATFKPCSGPENIRPMTS